MATLWVTEYRGLATEENGRGIPIPQEPAITTQTVSFTTTTASSAFNSATRYVRLIASADCHVKFGSTAPTATTSDQKLIAGQEIFRGVRDGYFVAAVTAS